MENQNSVCFVARIGEVKPIEGADNIEVAVIGGWNCIVPKLPKVSPFRYYRLCIVQRAAGSVRDIEAREGRDNNKKAGILRSLLQEQLKSTPLYQESNQIK